MRETQKSDSCELWSGIDNIQQAFDALGEPSDVPIQIYLQNVGRVVVKNDPALAKVFGQSTVDRYEAMLSKIE